MRVTIKSGVLDLGEAPILGISPPQPPLIPPAPPERVPYFQVGEASGKPGEIVDVPVFGGCSGAMSGFHFGCGCGGWDNVPQGVTLSQYLTDYTAGKSPFESFQYAGKDARALPEAFCEYALGLFSIGGETMIPPIPIPPGTELFRISIKIAESAIPGAVALTCKDEWFYTHHVPRRRDYLYTNDRQGYSAIHCLNGKLTVVA